LTFFFRIFSRNLHFPFYYRVTSALSLISQLNKCNIRPYLFIQFFIHSLICSF